MREACAIVPDAPRREPAATKLSYRLITRDSPNHEALLDLVQAAHEESRFGYIPFSRDKARRVMVQALTEGARHLIAVAEIRGRPEGFVFASVGEYLVGTGALIVTVNAIYTSRNLRGSLLGGRTALGLFRAVARWSKGIGAREILLHATSGIGGARTLRTIDRIGFKLVGGTYVATVS